MLELTAYGCLTDDPDTPRLPEAVRRRVTHLLLACASEVLIHLAFHLVLG